MKNDNELIWFYYYLLGKALLGDACGLPLPAPISSAQWELLFQIAAVQHTAPLIGGSLGMLPPDMQPPCRNKFLAEQLFCQNASEKHSQVLQRLLHTAQDCGAQVMVIKGVTIARHYPTPSLRYSSDIDFFLVGDEEGFLRHSQQELGATKINSKAYHHTTFKVDGTTLECHHDFVGVWDYRKLDARLLDMIKDADGSHKFRGEPILLPSNELSALFLMGHAHKSCCGRRLINTRSLCDWVAMIKECRSDIDWQLVRHHLAESHLEGFLDAYNAIAVKYMGMPQEWVDPPIDAHGVDFLAETVLLSAQPRPTGSRFRQYAARHRSNLLFAAYLSITGLASHYRFTRHFERSQSFVGYMATNVGHRALLLFSRKRTRS